MDKPIKNEIIKFMLSLTRSFHNIKNVPESITVAIKPTIKDL